MFVCVCEGWSAIGEMVEGGGGGLAEQQPSTTITINTAIITGKLIITTNTSVSGDGGYDDRRV